MAIGMHKLFKGHGIDDRTLPSINLSQSVQASVSLSTAHRGAARRLRSVLQSALVLFGCSLTPGVGIFAAGPMTPADVARSLGTLHDGARQNAIAAMARGAQIAAPLSGADGAAILLGTTQGSRAAAIAELAALFKADLSGQEAAAILGPDDVLTDGNRQNAIAALARAKRFGPSIGEDAALALRGATQGSRAAAIAEIAPYLRVGISGLAIAAVVGPASAITDGNRQNAITAIARTTKQIAVLSGADGAAILLGATQGSRAAAIAELATSFKADLSGQEAAAILGPDDVLTDGNRQNAIAALARAKRFGPSIGEDAALALMGATQGSRAAAIAEIAPYLRVGISGSAIAAVVGPASAITDGNRQNAITAIARTTKQIAVLSGADGAAILLGATQGSRAAAIAELAALFKTDLSGQEAAAILGSDDVLTDGNRQNAIAALARAKRFGPSIGEDAAMALRGTTQGSRAAAIAELAPYLRNGMSGQAVAAILGDPSVLSEGNRYNAINALASAGKLLAGFSGDEISLIVQGTTGQTRVGAIALIANAAKQQIATQSSSIPSVAVASAPVQARPVENTQGVGFRSTSDFVVEPAVVRRGSDNSLYLELRVFNIGEADGVLEVFDHSGQLVSFPQAILGNRRIPDSVFALVVGNQVKVALGVADYVFKGQSPLDSRSRFQSRQSDLNFMVPPRGGFRITKASPYALSYNLLFFGLNAIGYIEPGGTTISQRLMQDIVKTIALEHAAFIAERLGARSLSYSDLLKLACDVTIGLVGVVLKPENLDGRKVLGAALKKYLVTANPFTEELAAVAKLGDAFNWVNAFANLAAARTRDTSIVIQRSP